MGNTARNLCRTFEFMGVEGLLDGFGLSDWNRVQNPQVFVESSRISNEAASGLGVMGAYDSGLGVAVCALSACYVLEGQTSLLWFKTWWHESPGLMLPRCGSASSTCSSNGLKLRAPGLSLWPS